MIIDPIGAANSSPTESAARDPALNALIESARGGSKEALGELFLAYRDYLLAIANSAISSDIRPKVAPSDVVQQSLAEACLGFDQFEGMSEDALRGWLRRILLNNVQDATREYRGTAMRDITREVPLAGDDSRQVIDANLIADQPSPSENAALSEEQRLFEMALARMPADYALVIRKRNLEYRSFHDIGEMFSMSADAARKLWERAVKQLAKELKAIR